MIRYDRRARAFATMLSGLAGFVDSVAFLSLGGFFVSFMSGNTTRLGVGLATDLHHAALAGMLVASFVLGVIGGSLTGHAAGSRRASAVLAAVAAMLAIAGLLDLAGLRWLGVAAVAAAMGAENAVFERDGDVLGLTYMTGTLVKLGQRLAARIAGRGGEGWPSYLFHWLGLAAGASLGAAAWLLAGFGAIWIAAGVAAALGALGPGRRD